MDRYDELLSELKAAQGMPIEKALRARNDTILVQVGRHSNLYADVRTLALNDADAARLTAEIETFWPQAIAPVSYWRQLFEARQEELA